MKKAASAVDWPTVLKYLAGGALVGTGTGAAVSAARYLKTLQDKARKQHDTSYDDDVAYINLPKQATADVLLKSAAANTGSTFALSGLAALLGGYGAYSGVRSVYRKRRKKQLQAELDRAQQIHLETLQGQSKQADFSMLSKGVGSAYLALLLTALGGGVVTNKILQKQFPVVKSPNRGKPRKIVIRTAGEETVEQPKSGVTPDALEGLTRTVMAKQARAQISGLQDLVCAIAKGRADEIDRMFYSGGGVEGVFGIVKGASNTLPNPVACNMALTVLCSDPLYKYAFAPIIASEYYDMASHWCKLAGHVDEEFKGDLYGLVEAFPHELRKSQFANLLPAGVKQAASLDLMDPTMLAMALRQTLNTGDPGKTPMDTGGNSASSVDSDSYVSDANPVFEVDDASAELFRKQNQDVLSNAIKRT